MGATGSNNLYREMIPTMKSKSVRTFKYAVVSLFVPVSQPVVYVSRNVATSGCLYHTRHCKVEVFVGNVSFGLSGPNKTLRLELKHSLSTICVRRLSLFGEMLKKICIALSCSRVLSNQRSGVLLPLKSRDLNYVTPPCGALVIYKMQPLSFRIAYSEHRHSTAQRIFQREYLSLPKKSNIFFAMTAPVIRSTSKNCINTSRMSSLLFHVP